MKQINFESKFKTFKSIYLCISGGVDSALLLYLLCKYISENNLDIKITPITAVEPQPHYLRNDWNANKVTNIIRNIFPKVKINQGIVNFLEGYDRENHKRKEYSKVKKMRIMHTNNIKKDDFDLIINGVSSFPPLEELKKHPKLYDKSKGIGPEDRTYTGKKNDKIILGTKINKFGKQVYWWNPFLNFTKKDFANLYKKYDLMDNLFPYTASCTGKAEFTKNFTEPCKGCFWCLEKYWAFNSFDYPNQRLLK
jgi:hypothetical protein|tara:strand:+ start:580 stop:1335 length:756 start_codon:yes stop_codon:yes gene_type:complete